METMFKMLRDLSFIGEKVTMNGQQQTMSTITTQKTPPGHFIVPSMVWKIRISWKSAAFRDLQKTALSDGWALIVIHAHQGLKALMQSSQAQPALKQWNSRFIATEMLMISHAIGGQFKLLMVPAKATTLTWIQLHQPCQPSSQRNLNTKVSNSTTTSELMLKWMFGIRIPITHRISGNPSSKRVNSKSQDSTRMEYTTRSTPTTAIAMLTKALAKLNSKNINESELCSVTR